MLQKAIFSFLCFCPCFHGAVFYLYLSKLTSKRCFSKNSFGHPLFFRRVLKLCMFLLNVKCDEFVLRRRSAPPFMNPFFGPGG